MFLYFWYLKTECRKDKRTTRLLDRRFSMPRKILSIRRDGEPDSLESYSGDTRRSMYRRVYPRLTFEACARHFMYHSGRGGFVSVSHPCLLPRALFLSAQRGCLWVYYTADPVRSAAHTCACSKYVHTSV